MTKRGAGGRFPGLHLLEHAPAPIPAPKAAILPVRSRYALRGMGTSSRHSLHLTSKPLPIGVIRPALHGPVPIEIEIEKIRRHFLKLSQ